MIDVEALLRDARTEQPRRCATCNWLMSRTAVEAEQWRAALDDSSHAHTAITRAMRVADDMAANPGVEPPSVHSVANHRAGHGRSR